MRIVLLAALISLNAFAFGRHSPQVVNPSASPAHPTPGPSAYATVVPDPGTPPPTPDPLVTASPGPRPTDRIMLGTITGAQAGEIEMVHMGFKIANAMLDNPCYTQWVSAASYSENNGLTSPQIYTLQATQPNRVDVELYYQNNRVVGFEYDPYDGVVHMNRKFVNSASTVADNILHEDRGHGLGFHHYGKFSTSVPYGANYAYEGCSQQNMLARGKRSKAYRPPGIRIEVRHRKKAA